MWSILFGFGEAITMVFWRALSPILLPIVKTASAGLIYSRLDDRARQVLYTIGVAVMVLGSVAFVAFMGLRTHVAWSYAVATATLKHNKQCQFHAECPLRPPSHAVDADSNNKCDKAKIDCEIKLNDLALNEFMPPVGVVLGANYSIVEWFTLACLVAFVSVLGVRFVRDQWSNNKTLRRPLQKKLGEKRTERLVDMYRAKVTEQDADVFDSYKHY